MENELIAVQPIPTMDDQLIVVKQLPVIEEQLRSVRKQIEDRVASILQMECTEDTVRDVKKARSEMNALFRQLEQRRKDVKGQVERPYKDFETVYKECVSNIFSKADKELAQKIAAVENGLKLQRKEAVAAYFAEYRTSLGLPEDIATMERAGISITLSASQKSLKAQAKAFLDRIKDDLDLIHTQELADEILLEYRKSLNVSQSIKIVMDRHKAMEVMRLQREARERAEAERRDHDAEIQRAIEEALPEQHTESESSAQKVVSPPVVISAPVQSEIPAEQADVKSERKFSTAFRVTDTIERLRALKKFLNDGGYTYEQLN